MSDRALIYLSIACGVALYWFSSKALPKVVTDIYSKIDPTDPNNIAAKLADRTSAIFSGSTDSSFGSDLYDYLGPSTGSVTAPTPVVLDRSLRYSDEPILTQGSYRDLIH